MAMSELCPACGKPLQGEDIRFCGDQEYRYFLKVPLSGGAGVCLFLMLNPGSRDEDRGHNHHKRSLRLAERV